MIFYLPERIYTIAKDNSQYKSIIAKLEEIHSKFDTFEEFVNANPSHNKEIAELSNQMDTLMDNILANKPNLIEEYKINNGVYSKTEMMKKYYSNDTSIYDIENKFYLLSNIINKSYSDNTFPVFLNTYVDLYEVLDKDILNTLSKYIHLKYMYAKLYTLSRTVPLDHIDIFTKEIEDIYNHTIKATNEDSSIVLNYILEAINDGCKELLYRGVSIDVIRTILMESLFNRDTEDKEKYQYKKNSLSTIVSMDILNMIFLVDRNWPPFYHTTSLICKRISNSLNHKKELLRGLAYYDKCNHNLYALMIRKYLKLIKEVPMFSNISINNLSDVDKEYILSDRIGKDVYASSPIKITDTFTVNDIDKFFINNPSLELAKEIRG